MILRKFIVLTSLCVILFTSCSSDDSPVITSKGSFEAGILVAHEGNFSQGNASVSYVSNDFNTVTNNIYTTVNNVQALGDVLQSMSFYEDNAYLVLNNSQKIEVVNRYTFKHIATIDSGLLNPRYMVVINGKGYVSNWGVGADASDDYIAVIDLDTYVVSSTISVEEGPEKLVVKNSKIYVAHQGGFSHNNKISVIDTETNEVSTTITVGDVPNSLQFNASENVLWVLCGGKPSWTGNETAGGLYKINLNNNTVLSQFDFDTTAHPSLLNYSNNTFYYYLSGNVYALDEQADSLPTTARISNQVFYNMNVKDNTLYGTNAADFQSNGTLLVYDLNSNSEINTLSLGLIPSGIYFN